MRIGPAVTAGVLCLAAATASPATAHSEARCTPPPGSSHVRSSFEATVTVAKRSAGPDVLGSESFSRTWSGCATRRGAQFELERSSGSSLGTSHYASRFEVAGEQVAFLVTDSDRRESTTRLATIDLSDGSRWESEGVNSVSGSGTGFAEIAVDRGGNVAWIRSTFDGRGRRQWRLYLRDDGKVSLRYRSALPLTDLRLGDGRVQWRERGRARSYG